MSVQADGADQERLTAEQTFGQHLRAARTQKRWGQARVAELAFGNADRKTHVSAIERGNFGNRLTMPVAQQISVALSLPVSMVPKHLLWPEAKSELDNAELRERAEQAETSLKAFEAYLDRATKRLTEEATRHANNLNLTRNLVVELAQRYAEGDPSDFDSALAGLERALNVAHHEAERGRLPSNLPDAVAAVISRVDALNADGKLNEAAATLTAEETALADEEARLTAARERLFEKSIAQAILQNAPATAAAYALKTLDLQRFDTPADRFAALRAVQGEWYERGRDMGLNFDLEVAIHLARQCTAVAASADERGTAANDLGIALRALGERESGTRRLEDAVEAYRAALTEYTRARVPLDWAMTQNNLGNALWALGERESGTRRLEDAVEAYRAALTERTRARVPLDWAMTQNNLGNALCALGQRESGTRRLEEAVEAYRAALTERTRARVPLDWAGTQNNLGNALLTLGERESGTRRLEEAVEAHRAALTERTRARVPLDWAETQNNLGGALWTLGQRESGTRRLEEAVEAFRAALTVRTRARVPLHWAATQNNLGLALLALGQRESGTRRLEEAVEAYRAALTENTHARVPLDWAMTHGNIALVELAFAGKTAPAQRRAHLEAALAAVDAALEVFTPADTPFHHEKASRLREDILARLGS